MHLCPYWILYSAGFVGTYWPDVDLSQDTAILHLVIFGETRRCSVVPLLVFFGTFTSSVFSFFSGIKSNLNTKNHILSCFPGFLTTSHENHRYFLSQKLHPKKVPGFFGDQAGESSGRCWHSGDETGCQTASKGGWKLKIESFNPGQFITGVRLQTNRSFYVTVYLIMCFRWVISWHFEAFWMFFSFWGHRF